MPETLVAALTELEKSYRDIQKDASFQVSEQTPQLVASAVRSCTTSIGLHHLFGRLHTVLPGQPELSAGSL